MSIRKLIVTAVCACTSLWAAAPFASAKPGIEAISPVLVDVVPLRVFAPQGFDDNDNAQVVLDGVLLNTCYKLGPTHVRIDHEQHQIFIRQQAYYYPGGWCAEVTIPYAQTVNVGILRSGTYDVMLESNLRSNVPATTLPVAVATSSSPDDFLYAPITDAHLEHAVTTPEQADQWPVYNLILNGYFSSSCMHFKEIRTHVRANHVVEVLPIVTLDSGHMCAEVTTEFNVSVALRNLEHGRYLLHVRSLNGQAVNRIADL